MLMVLPVPPGSRPGLAICRRLTPARGSYWRVQGPEGVAQLQEQRLPVCELIVAGQRPAVRQPGRLPPHAPAHNGIHASPAGESG
jgi:hypothetical protein